MTRLLSKRLLKVFIIGVDIIDGKEYTKRSQIGIGS